MARNPKLVPDLPLSSAPVPATHKAKPRQRRINRVATGTAAQAIGAIEHECEVFALTNGQFGLTDILEHVIETTGPANVNIATWTAADGDLRRAHAFLLSSRITSCRFIVDPSFRSRKPEFCATLVNLFGNDAIRTTPLHGKFATIRNDEWSIAIRSSMNLNTNRRIETVEISDDPALCSFLCDLTDEIFARTADGNFSRKGADQNAHHDITSRLAF